MKVMIVDDHQDIVTTLQMIMEQEGHETLCANNGEEFLSNVQQFGPDIVLLDVMMPGLTTKEILEQLKTRQLGVKVILITVVRFSDEEREALLAQGNVVDYIKKPFDVFNLKETVSKHLKEGG